VQSIPPTGAQSTAIEQVANGEPLSAKHPNCASLRAASASKANDKQRNHKLRRTFCIIDPTSRRMLP
jgi:hypothetical protein